MSILHDDDRLLGGEVPQRHHFETRVARILLDDSDAPKREMPPEQQRRLLTAVARWIRGFAGKTGGLLSSWRMLAWLDRDALPHCGGQTRREVLGLVCEHAPQALGAMPQASGQVHAISRALYVSSVLHPDALRRIEAAIRADDVGSGGRP